METQTEKAIRLFRKGLFKEAFKIFKTFKAGFTAEERRILSIAHEINTGNGQFYETLGINTAQIADEAKRIISEKYAKQLNLKSELQTM